MLTRPLTQPLTGPLVRGVGEGGVVSAFKPSSLYVGGYKGIALDLSDETTLYQDSARTTLVSVAGDPIGSPSDISGNGAHPTQATTSSKPLWQTTYAGLDGVDDYWVTPSLDFSGTNVVTVVAGIYKGSDTGAAVVCELSTTSSTTAGTFALFAPVSAGSNVVFRSGGTTPAVGATASGFAAPLALVATGIGKIAAPSVEIRVNGVSQSISGTSQGTGNYISAALYVGRRAGTSLPFTGRIYRLIVIGRALTASETAQAERWCATPTGVTL